MNLLTESDYELLRLCVKEDVAKWQGQLPNWKLIGDRLGRTNNAVGKQYRKLAKRVHDAGTTIDAQLYAYDHQTISDYVEVDPPSVTNYDDVETMHYGTTITNTPIEQMMINLGLEPNEFEVVTGKSWGSPTKPMFTGKFDRKLPDDSMFDNLMKRVSDFNLDLPSYTRQDNTHRMAVVSVYDVHLEKLMIDGTGINETSIAYKKVISELIAKIRQNGGVDKIVFPVGNDFGNTDNALNTTTLGTPQQNSTTWKIGVDKQAELATYAIELLRTIAHVDVIMIEGNHDRYSNKWLGKFLEGYYRNTDDVVVDNSNNSRKYTRFGKVALMFTHGSDLAPAKRPMIFNIEASEMFGQCKFRYVNSGHLHGRKDTAIMLSEEHGVIDRILPGLTGTDQWHLLKGYIENNQTGVATVYDATKGISDEFYVHV